ncbi:ABC transporter permease [Neobacillus muris]|uniref:ABC transporter permease n=1 Tax=Neobacillus muris TaxID=2941334 RepID=UPI00203FD268|nr:ABC transporter permease [Neobacillus muris]
MKDILWLIQHTLRKTFRNKKNIILYLCMPLIGIFIALLAHSDDQTVTLHVGIVDQDKGEITTDTIQFLKGLENVEISMINEDMVSELISSGKLDTVITFEAGYAASIYQGNPGHLRITSIKGDTVNAYIKSYLHQYIDNLATIGYAAGGNLQTFETMYNNFQQIDFKLTTNNLEDSSSSKYMTNQTIGFLIFIMLMSATNLSEIILLEKEQRTYYRLLSTPINARKYILSNIIVNLIVMIMQILVTITIMRTLFHIGTNIPFWQIFVVMLLFSFVSIGLSLVIISFSNSRALASALQNFIVTPTVMLSGCFWPIDVMPESLQKIADFLPQRWTLDTLTKLQEGNSFASLYLNLMILVAFALTFFLIAVYKFSRNNTTQNFI